MLEEQRRELLDQLDAVDKAIAALNSTGGAGAEPAEESVAPAPAADAPAEPAVSAIPSLRVKSKRVLSDAHKQAMIVGQRKARGARDAARGLAREQPDDSFVPAIGTRENRQPPRLVKRPTGK